MLDINNRLLLRFGSNFECVAEGPRGIFALMTFTGAIFFFHFELRATIALTKKYKDQVGDAGGSASVWSCVGLPVATKQINGRGNGGHEKVGTHRSYSQVCEVKRITRIAAAERNTRNAVCIKTEIAISDVS